MNPTSSSTSRPVPTIEKMKELVEKSPYNTEVPKWKKITQEQIDKMCTTLGDTQRFSKEELDGIRSALAFNANKSEDEFTQDEAIKKRFYEILVHVRIMPKKTQAPIQPNGKLRPEKVGDIQQYARDAEAHYAKSVA